MKVISQIEAIKIRQIGQGQGKNSDVYLCHDPQLNGEIVIKEIPLSTFTKADDYFREASIFYANKHSNVAPVLYACRDSTCVRIAMPYYKNGTLEDLLDKKPLTVREIINITEQFLNGLHRIHSNGYVHYDIKPTNILFSDDNIPLVTDFGQSRETTAFGTAPLPPLYPSHFVPEAFTGPSATKQSDIFQVGLTLYRMCNGNDYFRKQFNFKTQQEFIDAISNGKFPNRDMYLQHIPLRLRRIIKKCLELNPQDRYQTCLELSNELVKVNQLLTWSYMPQVVGEIWVNDGLTHEEIIEIAQNTKGNWGVLGYKRRKSDGQIRNNIVRSKKGFKNQKDAQQYVYKLFRRME
ncbi:serine/threonine-protein kinase [Bacillus sp. J33]|uniref:serine/threonine-protein kinase n=1 Tax=Bacillus sp. J33 TaxID=935836 RepID=UPI000688D09F|nr:serine/threonine-protein kinase [Bacillus sp. J33]